MPLTNAQFDSIMDSYSQRRLANYRIQEARREEAYQKIPELAEIDNAISGASLTLARHKLRGTDDSIQDMAAYYRSIEENKERRLQLLQEHGYPADYLDPVYTCKICHDTGFVDGKRCVCFKQESTDFLSRESNLSEVVKTENFRHFSTAYYSKTITDPVTGLSSYDLMRKNLGLVKQFVDSFGSDYQNLFLYGNTGLGKTFLSHCIAKELMDRHFFVVYFSAAEFFDMAGDRHFRRDSQADALYKRAVGAYLVILDDVGTEVPNGFSVSALFTFLNRRAENRLATIISTNLTLEQFKDIYGERIFSRLMDSSKFLPFVGDDIRQQKRVIAAKKEGNYGNNTQ